MTFAWALRALQAALSAALSALRAALRAAGVPKDRNVWSAGESAKGLRREWLDVAATSDEDPDAPHLYAVPNGL